MPPCTLRQWPSGPDFCPHQELELYKVLQEKIAACDAATGKVLREQVVADEDKRQLKAALKPYKRVKKNAPQQISSQPGLHFGLRLHEIIT